MNLHDIHDLWKVVLKCHRVDAFGSKGPDPFVDNHKAGVSGDGSGISNVSKGPFVKEWVWAFLRVVGDCQAYGIGSGEFGDAVFESII